MSKRWLLAVTVFFALGFSLSAQDLQALGPVQPVRLTLNQTGANGLLGTSAAAYQAGLFRMLNNAWYGPTALTLGDGRFFSFPGTFAWIEPVPLGFIPTVLLAEPPRATSETSLARNQSSTPVDLVPRADYIGGEVGGFYGRSTGKNGLEVKGGYIQSEIIQGNTYIKFGASYEESSGRLPRFGR